MSEGKLFVISAPSGGGKGSIIKQVLARREKLFFSISATTRPMRNGEQDGREYHFVSKAAFQERIASGGMLEWASYQGAYYGTPAEPVEAHLRDGWDVLLELEAVGMHNVKKLRPDAITMFIYPPSFAVLEQRLRDRKTEPEEKILGRLQQGREEAAHAGDYDYIIINDRMETAIQEVMSIMAAEKNPDAHWLHRFTAQQCRTENRIHIIKEDKTL